jgi:lysophospholipase L1-like esterase
MALGDSITGSPGCWRALLWQKLPAARVDFVGTLPPQGCGFTYDGENEGHGGYLATNVASQNLLVGWLAVTHPDVVMMHFGTNDVWSNLPTATILAAFTRMVGQMRASKPTMKILVAQIIPMNPSTCAECAQRVVNLNAAIPAWAASLTTAASPITVVDQFTGFVDATDTYDGVHPNDAGNVKIANRWYPAVSAAIS